MQEVRQLILVIFFVTLCVFVMALSYQSDWDRLQLNQLGAEDQAEAQESYFRNINYFVNKEQPFLQLDASELSINDVTKQTVFFEPKGVALSEKREPIYYEGQRGHLNQVENILVLDQDAKVRIGSSNSIADKMEYYIDEGKVISLGNVQTKSFNAKTRDKLTITSDWAVSWFERERSRYRGNVQGKIIREKAYEQNLDFKSRYLDLNMKTNYGELREDVHIKKQQLRASSLRGEIFLENYNKKLKYFVLYDDVKVVEKVIFDPSLGSKKGSYMRKSFSEKLEGIMSEDKVILTGYPKVYQQDDVIKGNKIILRENNEVVEVDDANTNFILKN